MEAQTVVWSSGLRASQAHPTRIDGSVGATLDIAGALASGAYRRDVLPELHRMRCSQTALRGRAEFRDR